MRNRCLAGTIFFIMVAFCSISWPKTMANNFFSFRTVEYCSAVMQSERSIVEIVELGSGQFLVCLEGKGNEAGLKSFSVCLYDSISKFVTNEIFVEDALSCKIKKSQENNLFVIVYGNESPNSKLVCYDGGKLVIVGEYFEAGIIAADQGLFGMVYFEPVLQSGKIIPGTDVHFGILPMPGPFGSCEGLNRDEFGGTHFLSREFAVLYWDDGSEQDVFRMDQNCSNSWRTSLPSRSRLVGYGDLGAEKVAVFNTSKGSLGISLKSGSAVDIGTGHRLIRTMAFFDGNLFYPHEDHAQNKGSISKGFVLRKAGFNSGVLGSYPLPGGECPERMESADGILVCHLKTTDSNGGVQTALYFREMSSAILVEGYWYVMGISDGGSKCQLLGAPNGAGDLILGSISF